MFWRGLQVSNFHVSNFEITSLTHMSLKQNDFNGAGFVDCLLRIEKYLGILDSHVRRPKMGELIAWTASLDLRW